MHLTQSHAVPLFPRLLHSVAARMEGWGLRRGPGYGRCQVRVRPSWPEALFLRTSGGTPE